MNKLLAIMTGTILCACSFNATKAEAETAVDNAADSTKVLVAYYSATGTTRAVAEAISDAAGATLYEIVPADLYTTADLDWRDSQSRSTIEMNDSTSRPAIAGEAVNAADYDVIFVGFPIWWDLCPRVVNTWIESQQLEGKKVIPFATSGSSSIDNSVRDLRRLYPDVDWQQGKLLNGGATQAASWTKETLPL